MFKKPQEIIENLGELASLPEVVLKLNELVESPDSTTRDLEEVLQTDPALTARLLKIANSSLYGYTSQIDTIKRAIMVVGTNGIRDIAWATAAVSSMSSCNPPYADIRSFWRHSLYVATVARILASKCRILRKDRFFTAGLLHDIGRLVYFREFPEMSQQLIDKMEEGNQSLRELEQEHCGFTHAELGACLLESWGLPDSICAMTKFHQSPDMSNEYRLDIALIHIANSIAHQAGVYCCGHEGEEVIQESAWHTTGLSSDIIESVIGLADEHYQEAEAVFLSDFSLAPAA